jgi:AraC-like DNA-binding protein
MQAQAFSIAGSFEPAGPAMFRADRHYLLYAVEGVLRLEAQGRRWTLPPARAALIRAGCPVAITVLSRLRAASVLFAQNFMEAPEAELSVFDISPLTRELVKECRQWDAESGVLEPYARQMFAALAMAALKDARSPTPCMIPLPASPALARAVQLTEELAGGQPRFSEIARLTGQSPRALARRFADEMGMSWRELLRRLRIVRAVEMLAERDRPVTEIALSCGYESVSAFNAAFRDLMKTSPSDYRRTFR